MTLHDINQNLRYSQLRKIVELGFFEVLVMFVLLFLHKTHTIKTNRIINDSKKLLPQSLYT